MPRSIGMQSLLVLFSIFFSSMVMPAETPMQPLKVAFVITENANVMDFAGPWEVFRDARVGSEAGFALFTVSESTNPITMSGGLRAVPEYSFQDAPHPSVVVVGAQQGSPGLTKWLQSRAKDSQVVMSVCTGAFKLGEAGLLDGLKAATHHDYWDEFENKFPKAQLQRGDRYVQSSDVIYTAGGLTSGIDLALQIVEKFYGREAADQTAAYLEYRRAGHGLESSYAQN